MNIHEKKSLSVALQLDNARQIHVQQNRKILGSIVDTILFIGRQETACRLSTNALNGRFIVTMVVIHEVFATAHPLSIALQAKDADLASAMEMGDDLSNLLKAMRADSIPKLHTLFAIAQKLAEDIGCVLEVSRTTARQVYRENYQSTSTGDFFRVNVFIPFLDHFINQFEIRSLKHKGTLSKIQNALPSNIVHCNVDTIDQSVESILNQWPDITSVVSKSIVKKEALLWKQKWIDAQHKPRNFIDALNFCKRNNFPNIHKI